MVDELSFWEQDNRGCFDLLAKKKCQFNIAQSALVELMLGNEIQKERERESRRLQLGLDDMLTHSP